MKYLQKIVTLLIVAAMLLSVVGCQTGVSADQPDEGVSSADTQPSQTDVSPEELQQQLTELYETAVEAVNSGSVELLVDYERSVTVGGHTYGESGSITQDYFNIDTDDFLARVKHSVTYGDNAYDFKYQEIYSDGVVYQTLTDSSFMAEMSAENFIARYVPLKMLDPALYTLSVDDSGSVIIFAEATGAESWLIPEGAELISATATAKVWENALTGTAYSARYIYGAATFDVTYDMMITSAGRAPMVPDNTAAYLPLDDIDSVLLLDHAYGYLGQARHITCGSKSMIMSEAAAFLMQSGETFDVYAVGDEYAMNADSSITIYDLSTGSSDSYDVTERLVDGKYTVSENGGREENVTSFTQEYIETSILSSIQEWILASEYIQTAEVTELGGLLLIEYTCTEEMGENMCYDTCSAIFENPDVLNDAATSYTTDTMTHYLALDSYSLLPTAAGILYEGTHVIGGYKYALTRQIDQYFDLASMSAYDAIFEEPAPEEEPENPATPLFYHVTGADGQEMWLFGTIHVGDNRTAFLPQEIYDAFYASDALAIECNVDAFYEQVEEDEELQSAVSDLLYYSNSTIADHIETPDLYDTAVKLMKATGNYNFNIEYLKADSWASAIDNYRLGQGYALSSEKGVESRLTALAEEDDMPVWEVESTLFQMEMTSNFSEHLQEVMLYSSTGDSKSSWESTMELYELWCAGDEEALIEALASEPWDMKEEDFDLEGLSGEDLERAEAILADLDNINAQLAVLQEEYYKAMEFDRNVGMLEVAKGYLESGDTVFYAVGLAHLLAENGLVNTLREAGYTVELVDYQ